MKEARQLSPNRVLGIQATLFSSEQSLILLGDARHYIQDKEP